MQLHSLSPCHFEIQLSSPLSIDNLFQSGQFHGWKRREDGAYLAFAGGRRAVFYQKEGEGQSFYLDDVRGEELDFWLGWLDLDFDYTSAERQLSHDPYLAEAIGEGGRLRILRQPVYDTILAFILSANNNMPRIRLALEQLSRFYGEKRRSALGAGYYSLPRPETLAGMDAGELRHHCSVGYRDQALISFGRSWISGDFDPRQAEEMGDEDLLHYLLRLRGVGPKVGSCIQLYGFHRLSAFPVDVWVRRIMQTLYPLKGASDRKIADFAQERFGPLAGLAQQYLFVFARSHPELFS